MSELRSMMDGAVQSFEPTSEWFGSVLRRVRRRHRRRRVTAGVVGLLVAVGGLAGVGLAFRAGPSVTEQRRQELATLERSIHRLSEGRASLQGQLVRLDRNVFRLNGLIASLENEARKTNDPRRAAQLEATLSASRTQVELMNAQIAHVEAQLLSLDQQLRLLERRRDAIQRLLEGSPSPAPS